MRVEYGKTANNGSTEHDFDDSYQKNQMLSHKEAAVDVACSPAMSPSSASVCSAGKPNDLETVALTEQQQQKLQVCENICVRRITGA